MCTHVQETLHEISKFFKNTLSTINPVKECVTRCSLNNKHNNTDLPEIRWNEQAIELKDRMKYLGITLNSSLSFKYNIDHILQKAEFGLTAVNTMAAKVLEQRLLVILFNHLAILHWIMDWEFYFCFQTHNVKDWSGYRMKG